MHIAAFADFARLTPIPLTMTFARTTASIRIASMRVIHQVFLS
jgi:hypothetical protein